MRKILWLCLSLPFFTPPVQLAVSTPFFLALLSAVSPHAVSTWEEFPVRMCVHTHMEMHTATASQCSKKQAWQVHLPLHNLKSLEILQALIRLCLCNADELICKHGRNKQEQTSLSAVMVLPGQTLCRDLALCFTKSREINYQLFAGGDASTARGFSPPSVLLSWLAGAWKVLIGQRFSGPSYWLKELCFCWKCRQPRGGWCHKGT